MSVVFESRTAFLATAALAAGLWYVYRRGSDQEEAQQGSKAEPGSKEPGPSGISVRTETHRDALHRDTQRCSDAHTEILAQRCSPVFPTPPLVSPESPGSSSPNRKRRMRLTKPAGGEALYALGVADSIQAAESRNSFESPAAEGLAPQDSPNSSSSIPSPAMRARLEQQGKQAAGEEIPQNEGAEPGPVDVRKQAEQATHKAPAATLSLPDPLPDKEFPTRFNGHPVAVSTSSKASGNPQAKSRRAWQERQQRGQLCDELLAEVVQAELEGDVLKRLENEARGAEKEAVRKKAEDEGRKRREEEERLSKEAARKKVEAEEFERKKVESARKKDAEEAAARKKAEEAEAAKRKADAAAARKKTEEEAAQKKAEEEDADPEHVIVRKHTEKATRKAPAVAGDAMTGDNKSTMKRAASKADVIAQLQPLLQHRCHVACLTLDEAAPLLAKMGTDFLQTALTTGNVQPVLTKLKAAAYKKPEFRELGYSSAGENQLLSLLRAGAAAAAHMHNSALPMPDPLPDEDFPTRLNGHPVAVSTSGKVSGNPQAKSRRAWQERQQRGKLCDELLAEVQAELEGDVLKRLENKDVESGPVIVKRQAEKATRKAPSVVPLPDPLPDEDFPTRLNGHPVAVSTSSKVSGNPQAKSRRAWQERQQRGKLCDELLAEVQAELEGDVLKRLENKDVESGPVIVKRQAEKATRKAPSVVPLPDPLPDEEFSTKLEGTPAPTTQAKNKDSPGESVNSTATASPRTWQDRRQRATSDDRVLHAVALSLPDNVPLLPDNVPILSDYGSSAVFVAAEAGGAGEKRPVAATQNGAEAGTRHQRKDSPAATQDEKWDDSYFASLSTSSPTPSTSSPKRATAYTCQSTPSASLPATPAVTALVPTPRGMSSSAQVQEKVWDDSFFADVLEEDANRTISTSFYTPNKKSEPTSMAVGSGESVTRSAVKMKATKVEKGSLGVRIRDVKVNDTSRVKVFSVATGGLVWRQGDVKAGDFLVRLNGTFIRDCDHLNELVDAASRDETGLVLEYQKSAVLGLFTGTPKTHTVTLYKTRVHSPCQSSDISGTFSSPMLGSSTTSSSPAASEAYIRGVAHGIRGVSPGFFRRPLSLDGAASPPDYNALGESLESVQSRSTQHAKSSVRSPPQRLTTTNYVPGPDQALVPDIMIFHDADLNGLLNDGPVLKDVMGHELQHSGAQADWFHEYELSDGQVLDLSRCRLVHWYFLKGDVWVPYSAEDSDLLETAHNDGYDAVEFGANTVLLPERVQVHGSDNSRQTVRRGTWHFQRRNGTFAPFPESAASLLQQSFLRPSLPNQQDTSSRTPNAQTRYGLPVQEAVVDVGDGRRVERLDSGIIVQRRTDSVLTGLRIVVHGQPQLIHGRRAGNRSRRGPAPSSVFSFVSDMGTVTPFAFSEDGGGGNAAQAAQKKAHEIISPRTPPKRGFR